MKKEYIIIILILSLFILFFLIALILRLVWGQPQPILCPSSWCPTNLVTGERDCQRREYNPEIEVCNPAEACTSNRTPCRWNRTEEGLLESVSCPGDNSYDNRCSVPDESCGCLPGRICPPDVLVYFQVIELSSGLGGKVERIFVQKTAWNLPQGGYSTVYPLQPGIGDSCYLTDESISRVWPPHCIRGQWNRSEEGKWTCR